MTDVKAIYAAGHDLANHSENHKDMVTIGTAEQKEELMKVHERVKELTGCEMTLFRPPYGSYNNDLISTAEACGYYPIQWSVDSLDWKDYGVDSIISTVCEHKALENGAIILMHNGATYTARALETVIKTIKEKGYEIVPISELIYKDNYHMGVAGRQISDETGESTGTPDFGSSSENGAADLGLTSEIRDDDSGSPSRNRYSACDAPSEYSGSLPIFFPFFTESVLVRPLLFVVLTAGFCTVTVIVVVLPVFYETFTLTTFLAAL